MRSRTRITLFALTVSVATCLHAQTSSLEPGNKDTVPTVGFSFELAGADPSYYSFSLESTGRAAYTSRDSANSNEAPGTPYMVKFVVSESNRTRIFQLAEKLHYFQGKFDYGKGRIANTGIKTLSYHDDKKNNQTTYNYSNNPAIQELTRIFQHISTTLEFGRQLEYLYDHQKLGLDEQLKRMDQMAREGNLEEIQAIASVLQKIAKDSSIFNMDREHARQLLQMAAVPLH